MADYDEIAKFYDYGIALPEEAGEVSRSGRFVKNAVKNHNPKAQSILDLACGTGNLLKEIENEFDTLQGLDISGAMLEVAKRKVTVASFLQKDMRTFDLPESFDVISCMYDSINHLLTFSDWERCFAQINKHLNDDGLFLFDFNSIERLEKLSRTKQQLQKIGDGQNLHVEVTKKDGLYVWEIRIKTKRSDGEIVSQEARIKESSYSLSKIRKSLEKKFTIRETLNKQLKSTDKDEGRLYLACQK